MRQTECFTGAPMIAMVLALTAFPAILYGAGPDFGSYWHDGRAELDGYRLTISRYGEPRSGRCVMIYVTEPFSEKKRVKVDDPHKNPSDTFAALKLNLIRDFQTGIYDYNTMVSVFTRSDDFSPVKITFTSAEWCGQVYEELWFWNRKVTGWYYSYFEGESTQEKLDLPENGISEDNLFVALRGLRGDFLKPGEKRSYPLLPSLFYSRLSHKPLAWATAEIARLEEVQEVEVPAGKYSTIVYTVSIDDGREGTFFIERDYPHRVVRWELEPDISGELTGSTRLAYWKLHDNGHETYLEELGLSAAAGY